LGSVVILSAEDSSNDTLRPRLEAAGADLARVHALQGTKIEGRPVTFSLQAHLEMLGDKLVEIGDVALVDIDPITSYMGRSTDIKRLPSAPSLSRLPPLRKDPTGPFWRSRIRPSFPEQGAACRHGLACLCCRCAHGVHRRKGAAIGTAAAS